MYKFPGFRYLDRYIAEDAFRITKSDKWCKMNPVFHWPGSKILHALTCMIALLLMRIAHKRARAKGITHGAQRLLELLSSTNMAILLYPKSTKAAVRVRCSISKEQEDLLTAPDCQVPHSM